MIKRIYGTILCFICISGVFLFAGQPAYAAINYIEFRLVLDGQEPDGMQYDTILSGNEALRISKFYFLSNIDIEEVIIFRSLTARDKIIAGFRFTEDGKKRLDDTIRKYPDHKIAIFAHNSFLTTLPARSADCIAIVWPRAEKDLSFIAKEINKKPDSIIDLYIDETAKYNDVAAEEWANVYNKVVKRLNSKKSETPPPDYFPPGE